MLHISISLLPIGFPFHYSQLVEYGNATFIGSIAPVSGFTTLSVPFTNPKSFFFTLKSATKPFNLLLACTRPLFTEFADN